MAQNTLYPPRNAEPPAEEPLLRQGRHADPVPVAKAVLPEDHQQDTENGEEFISEPSESAAVNERTVAESRQRKLRLMLRQCDRVMLMDFDILAMADWPDNYAMTVARRSRDLWLFCLVLAGLVFLSGMTGLVPAWMAGGGFGIFVILLISGVPSVRGLLTRKPSFLDLLIKRRRMLRDARKHIHHLEGGDGLLWQCARMSEFNAALRDVRFSELLALSEHRVLAKNLNRREHVRLYLICLLEAEKAYERAEKAFFAGHQQALDKGWESVASSSGGSA